MMQATVHALELHGVYFGKRFGLYAARRDAESSLTPRDLARAADIDERYAREWL